MIRSLKNSISNSNFKNMKKLSLKSLKVIKMTSEEKRTIKGGQQAMWDTSKQCNDISGPLIS